MIKEDGIIMKLTKHGCELDVTTQSILSF